MARATRIKKLLVKRNRTDANSIAEVLLTLQADTGQTGDLLQALDSSGNVIFRVTSAGAITSSGANTAAGLGVMQVAHAIYSFAVDGGVTGAITPASTAVLPANALLLGGSINVIAAVTSLGSATLAVGTTAGSSSSALLAATAKASLGTGVKLNAVPVFATPVKMSAAGSINVTVGAADLTAGVVEIFILYVVAANA